MRLLLPATAVVALLLAGCGGGGAAAPQAQPGVPCGALPEADPAAVLPPDLPLPEGAVLHDPASQGATSVVFAHLPGEDFVALRDALEADLLAQGYTVDTDQEAVEAEAHFQGGAHEGSVRVQQLCEGRLSVRWRLEG